MIGKGLKAFRDQQILGLLTLYGVTELPTIPLIVLKKPKDSSVGT